MFVNGISWTVRRSIGRRGHGLNWSRPFSKLADKWFNARKEKYPKDFAIQHFDSFYPNVYLDKWLPIRIALHWRNKYVAVVNPFAKDPDETAASFAIAGASDISYFYTKYRKHYERQRLRNELFEQKREKKRAAKAAEKGVSVEELESDIEVSDISDSELGGVLSAASDPENILEMFQTDIESLRDKEGFMENLSSRIDLNDFIPSSEMKYEEDQDNKDTYYRFYDPNCEFEIEKGEAPPFEIPEYPKMFSFPRESLQQFEPPKPSGGLIDYLLIDAAAILPVLALGIKPKDRVADLCAAPGGKMLLMLATLRPSFLLACDPNVKKFPILCQKVTEFIPQLESITSTYHLENCSAEDVDCEGLFDKVLVDAPSTNDRLAVQDNEDNYFKIDRTPERIELPFKQKSILMKGLKLLRPGGSLVYTTNSLSPIQNDGVVHMSLYELSQSTTMTFSISEMKEASRPLRGLYRFHTFRYGIQVLPNVINNCGPVYVCKINRIK